MEDNWKIAHALRIHLRDVRAALTQSEIELRQLETVRRLEVALVVAEREASEGHGGREACGSAQPNALARS